MSKANEAYEVGKSRGDDHTNYALSYGHPVSEKPTEVPGYYADHGRDFERGWKDGVKAARKRDAALG